MSLVNICLSLQKKQKKKRKKNEKNGKKRKKTKTKKNEKKRKKREKNGKKKVYLVVRRARCRGRVCGPAAARPQGGRLGRRRRV